MAQNIFTVSVEDITHSKVMAVMLERVASEVAELRDVYPQAKIAHVSHDLSFTPPIKYIASAFVTVDLD